MYTGTLAKRVPNPSSFIILEQNTVSFIVKAAATSSASMVDCAVSPCNPPLKLTGPSEKKRYVRGGRFSVVGVVTPLCVRERR